VFSNLIVTLVIAYKIVAREFRALEVKAREFVKRKISTSKIIISNPVTTFTSSLFASSGRKRSGRQLRLLPGIIIVCSGFSDFSFAEAAHHSPPAHSGTILVFGDSISAAYGMDRAQGWVQLLTERLATQKLDYKVINASVSGETTGGGLVRLPKTLQIHQPDLVIIELGGNDGLRGYPIDKIHGNLTAMVDATLESGADILLVGMVLPPNYGARYTSAFQNLFSEIASRFSVPFLPYLLQGTATDDSLIQRDGIHPTPAAQILLLEELWPKIETILNRQRSETGRSGAE